jgi:hypothetical protein
LIALNRQELDERTLEETMGCVFKYKEDHHHLMEELASKKLDVGHALE